MPYVQVDIDLDDVDTEDLLTELEHRSKARLIKRLKEPEKKTLKESIFSLLGALGVGAPRDFPIKTLDDKMKIEHLAEVWNKYTLQEIQNLLP